MKVFIVYFFGLDWDDDAYIDSVFSTKEKAQKYMDDKEEENEGFKEYTRIEEFELK